MPHFRDLSKIQIEQISDALHNRQYYLFSGAGTSLDSTNRTDFLQSAGSLRDSICDIVTIPKTRSLQQAYSLLDAAGIEEHITVPFTCNSAGPTTKLMSYPWKRIFTLNVDNCYEKALKETIGETALQQSVQIANYNADFIDYSPLSLQSIIHLHGSVDKSSEGYVFSALEYAKNLARPNTWMLTLTQLIRGEPFIVTGTSLDEIDFSYYIEQRRVAHSRSDLPPSILIEPYSDRLTEKLAEDHGLFIYEGTTLEFFEYIESLKGTPPRYWDIAPPDGLDAITLPLREKLAFSATLELVPKAAVSPARVEPFLLGAGATWGTIEARADIPRQVTPQIANEVQNTATSNDHRVLLLLSETGSGKSSLLRRLAFQLAKTNRNVFFFTGAELIEVERFGEIIDALRGVCFIFVDNWADHGSFFIRALRHIKRRDVIVVGTERLYRRAYIETGLSDEEIKIKEIKLDLTKREASNLITLLVDRGLADSIKNKSAEEIERNAKIIVGEPISIGTCRIQNNFQNFDRIINGVIRETAKDEVDAYVTVGISRFCFADGVERSVLSAARKLAPLDTMLDPYAKLPIVKSPLGSDYFIPARSVIADRVISVIKDTDENRLAGLFTDLANALAPRVNRSQIRRRTPPARLAGGLMDFDRVIKRFINSYAENFYDDVKENWDWNARYWEQCALLKLDRYLARSTEPWLLEEAIQNARFAFRIEQHPLSLTTLAKMLFTALAKGAGNTTDLFEEAWGLACEAIDQEARWANVKATAFVVLFNGVLSYIDKGGVLDGKQTEKLRDIVAITHQRRLRDSGMVGLRTRVVDLLL